MPLKLKLFRFCIFQTTLVADITFDQFLFKRFLTWLLLTASLGRTLTFVWWYDRNSGRYSFPLFFMIFFIFLWRNRRYLYVSWALFFFLQLLIFFGSPLCELLKLCLLGLDLAFIYTIKDSLVLKHLHRLLELAYLLCFEHSFIQSIDFRSFERSDSLNLIIGEQVL